MLLGQTKWKLRQDSVSLYQKKKELLENIGTAMAAFTKDATAQVETGNKAARTRARKISLEIVKAMTQFRKGIFGRIKKNKYVPLEL